MADAADEGFMIWQDTYLNRFKNESVSSGTLNSMVRMVNAGKRITLYFIPDGSTMVFDSFGKLREFVLSHCANATKKYFEKNYKEEQPALF